MKYPNLVGKLGLAAALSMANPSAHAEGVNKYTVDDANRQITLVSQEFEAQVLNCLNGIKGYCIVSGPLTYHQRNFLEFKDLVVRKVDLTVNGSPRYNVDYIMKKPINTYPANNSWNPAQTMPGYKKESEAPPKSSPKPDCRNAFPNMHIDNGVSSNGNGAPCVWR